MVAVTKCKNPKCKEYYHLPCAIVKGVIFNINFMRQFYKVSKNNEIPFYCSNHNKKISNKYKENINNDDNNKKNEEKKENTEVKKDLKGSKPKKEGVKRTGIKSQISNIFFIKIEFK